MTYRRIQEVRSAQASRDGDGVVIQRVTGMRHAGMDPILMIDELRSEHREDFAGGFPPHPHRGMQTLTYMKHGGIVHQDNQGNRGEICGGGAQWMSAGRGIIHSEMPTQDSTGLHGFQLWINLPRAEKMSAPRYRDVPADELTQQQSANAHITVIAGHWQIDEMTLRGPLHELEDRAGIADLQIRPNASITLQIDPSETLVGYVYDGAASQGADDVKPKQLFITDRAHDFEIQAGADGARLLLMRGIPIGEPVANYGPFVMNTPEELEQALRDYQSGNFDAA